MNKILKMKNGITLVALVITVIILLILAGISIATLTGSGLFEKARLAEQKSKNAQELEDSILADYENQIKQNMSSEKKLVELTVLDNVDEFSKTIQETEKLQYIINHDEVFMDKILNNEQLTTTLFNNDKAMDLIIENDIWRSEILGSSEDKSGEDSDIIKALDNSNPVLLPTTNLVLYDPTTQEGNVLFSSYLRNDSIHSPINAFVGGVSGKNDWETSNNGLPAYIGYDYGEDNEVWVYKTYVQSGNDSAPIKMFLQSSDDNIVWNTIYEFTKYTTKNEYVTEVVDSNLNNKKSRYWRLYITESDTTTYLDLLKIEFYAK